MVGPNFRVGKKIGCGNFGELRLGEKGHSSLSSLYPLLPGLPWHPPPAAGGAGTGCGHGHWVADWPRRVEVLPLAGGPCSVTEVPLPSSFHAVLDLPRPIPARRTDYRGVSHLLLSHLLWVCQGKHYRLDLCVVNGGGHRVLGVPQIQEH